MSGHGKTGPIGISDHALVRWLERAGVLDVEQMRAALATALDRAWQAGAALQAREFLILSDGLVFVVREGVAITVMPDDGRHVRAKAIQRRHAESD